MTKIHELLIVNLKRARARAGLSQMKLAMQSDLSLGFIGDIESGKKFPSPVSIEKMIKALHIEPYELFIDPFNPSHPVPIQRTAEMKEELLRRVNQTISSVFQENHL